MTLSLPQTRRFSRQIALPEVGLEGQGRLVAATVLVVGDDLGAAVAAEYLRGAGVGTVLRTEEPAGPLPGERWLERLRGKDAVVRAGFDDDALLHACVRLGLPLVVVRAQESAIDLLAFRQHRPCPHQPLDVPFVPAARAAAPTPADVLAGTLAATEILWILIAPGEPPVARHLRLPLDGGAPLTQEIPWRPACRQCSGGGPEAKAS